MATIVAVAGRKPHYRSPDKPASTQMPFIAKTIHLQWVTTETGNYTEPSETRHAI